MKVMDMRLNKLHRENFWQGLPPAWDSESQETLECCQVRSETADVKSFFFATSDGVFTFEPGQFVTLELEIAGETINRCYTISSSPARPHTISITVKRVPGGIVSNWLHDHLKEGDRLRVLPAAGDFTCARHPADKYLFLSAGSGVTPLMSMARAHYDLSEDRDIVFVHSARTPEDIIFHRELELIAGGQRHFRTHFICEHLGRRRDWAGLTGLLSLPALQLMAPDFLQREIFVCGPAPYMKAVRAMLMQAGCDPARYHEESFSFERPQEQEQQAQQAPPSNPSTHTASYTVNFQQSNREIRCGAHQHVLEAARSAGVRLASSCSQGMCGTCKVKLIAGKVDMQHKGGIRQREIDQGMVLLCCSKPLSDLVVAK